MLVAHPNSVGVEQDAGVAGVARRRQGGPVHAGDFFAWAGQTRERFECAAGNPPFIRYQRFGVGARTVALRLCARLGASFSGLTSSWAPFLVATAGLLKPGGRMAFVVPAEIGHAPYAAPLLEYLVGHFDRVLVVAVRDKLFPDLSEDCWLLYADGFGGTTNQIEFTPVERFEPADRPPAPAVAVGVAAWRGWNSRLRPFLLSPAGRDFYAAVASDPRTRRLGTVARVGIGYVTGANDFFHLRPSVARRLGVPGPMLRPAVRSGKSLSGGCVDEARVRAWVDADEPMLLLALRTGDPIPASVQRYLGNRSRGVRPVGPPVSLPAA